MILKHGESHRNKQSAIQWNEFQFSSVAVVRNSTSINYGKATQPSLFAIGPPVVCPLASYDLKNS